MSAAAMDELRRVRRKIGSAAGLGQRANAFPAQGYRRNHMGGGIAGDIQDSERSANVDHDFAPRLPCPDMIDRLGCIPERVASVDDWKNRPRLREFR